jgi:hypothetical protein
VSMDLAKHMSVPHGPLTNRPGAKKFVAVRFRLCQGAGMFVTVRFRMFQGVIIHRYSGEK